MIADPAVNTGSHPPNRSTSLNKASFTRRLFRKFLLVLIISSLGLIAMSFTSQRPANLGHVDGQLANCPDSPNCVSSQAKSEEHRIDPIPYESVQMSTDGQSEGPNERREALIQRIKETIDQNFSRVQLVKETEQYLHFEFKSLLFRFVDDVEFFLDDQSQQIHFRSASRVGYSDLGVNRKRMNQISQELKQ